ncbi:MAG: hypothetical protein JJE40_17515 [Vicinamibacteria bacterium]|nr:hypothetical protein [Vicinamibacteria bacterium]
MTEPLARLEARLCGVERALAEIESRLELLEGGSPAQPVMQVAAAHAETPSVTASSTDVVGTLTLIGRTFVIFAGAYLLRALTESGTLDRTTGAALGFAYAAAWTFVAWRVAPRHALSATFFGACTVLVGFPLLWEATTRFALLTPEAGAVALTATTGLVLVTAWRRQLHALAWVATIGACGLAFLLLVMTDGAIAFASFLIALGVATLWLGYDLEWTMLRWVAALVADLAVVGLVGRALTTPPRDAPFVVVAVQVLLLVGYLGSIAVRTLVRGRDVLPFEVVQTGAMLFAGLGGAMLVAYRTGTGTLALGVALLMLAQASYGAAFAFVDRQQGGGANFYFYTSLALVFALTGSGLVLSGPLLGVLWASLAVLAGWAARRFGRGTLAVHSVVYVAAAAVPSGLASASLAGLFASADAPWAPARPAAWAVLVAIALCWLLTTPVPGRAAGDGPDVSRWALACLVAASVAGVCVVVTRSMLPPEWGAPLLAAMVATVRTGVLAAAAIVVAWLGGRVLTHEFGALLYPVLAWGALKLLLEDFRTSPPSLLFVAFALYGGALIIGPRIAKKRAT